MRRSHLVLAGILVAVMVVVILLAALWPNEGPLWRLVMLKRIPIDNVFLDKQYDNPTPLSWKGYPVRGWATVKRWGETEKVLDNPMPDVSLGCSVLSARKENVGSVLNTRCRSHNPASH